MLLGIDVGTTHWKAGLFATDGSPIRLAARPARVRRTPDGHPYYEPDELWSTVAGLVRAVVADADPAEVAAAGVAGMAEAGLLVDRATGRPRSHVVPWFDPRSREQGEALARAGDPYERFLHTGLRPGYKHGLAKLLWLRARDPAIVRGAVWLSVADYIVLRLSGRMATDPTLAARTYAYRIDEGVWDEPWIRHLDLDPALFPPVRPSGDPAGTVCRAAAAETGLLAGTPAAVAGHDHLCTALAAGVAAPGAVVDSMGTAETLVGTLETTVLGEREFRSGLSYGPHVLPGRLCWLGGLPASGGSVEWLRARLGDEPLSYEQLDALVAAAALTPTGILYFPYLSGRGSPHSDARARAAFVELTAAHGRPELAKAVLEGTAFEVEAMRRAAEAAASRRIDEFVAVGGAKNGHWLQIKADVSGCRLRVPALAEATLLGAALIAGIGCGAYADEAEALAAVRDRAVTTIEPDPARHTSYARLYEDGYMALQGPLQQYSAIFSDMSSTQ